MVTVLHYYIIEWKSCAKQWVQRIAKILFANYLPIYEIIANGQGSQIMNKQKQLHRQLYMNT